MPTFLLFPQLCFTQADVNIQSMSSTSIRKQYCWQHMQAHGLHASIVLSARRVHKAVTA
jgi:hypothetical protein